LNTSSGETDRSSLRKRARENSDNFNELGVVNILKAGIGAGDVITNDKVSTIEFEIPVSFPVMRK
jgi:hypothetical protein